MGKTATNPPVNDEDLLGLITRHSRSLAAQLQSHHESVFPPIAEKSIRYFQPAEASKLVGVKEVHLRNIANDLSDELDVNTGPAGRRTYSVLDLSLIHI